MLKPPSRLRRLDAALADLPMDEEPMLLTELDGFLAGLSLCPEFVLPGEWLPYVWRRDEGAPFEDAEDARQFAAMVVAYHGEIARELARGRYRPLFEVDERNGDTLWEIWIEGFADAMTLRPDAWAPFGETGDDDVATALAGIVTLIDIARDASDLERAQIDRLTDEAPRLLPAWIRLLHGAQAAQQGPVATTAQRPAKIGRNEPCPCGSGRKWKRCCGLG